MIWVENKLRPQHTGSNNWSLVHPILGSALERAVQGLMQRPQGPDPDSKENRENLDLEEGRHALQGLLRRFGGGRHPIVRGRRQKLVVLVCTLDHLQACYY